jgi:hypothetical protein
MQKLFLRRTLRFLMQKLFLRRTLRYKSTRVKSSPILSTLPAAQRRSPTTVLAATGDSDATITRGVQSETRSVPSTAIATATMNFVAAHEASINTPPSNNVTKRNETRTIITKININITAIGRPAIRCTGDLLYCSTTTS